MDGKTLPESHLTVKTAEAADAPDIAAIHCGSLPGDYMTSLGQEFLAKVYYHRALCSAYAATLIPVKGVQTVGFVTVAHNSQAFSKEFLKKDFVALVKYALLAGLRNPLHFIKSIEVFLDVLSDRSPDIPGEIVFIAVEKSCRRQGIGKMLVREAMDYLRSKGLSVCRTKTLEKNIHVIDMYRKLGWHERERYRFIGKDYVTLISPG